MRVFQIARNRLLAALFHAPGIDLGRGFKIKGSRNIVFGRNFFAHRFLWLEAISTYRDQQFQPRIEVGDNVSLSDSVHITCIERIVIRDNVLVGSKVIIADHQHGNYRGEGQSDPGQAPADRRLGGGGAVEIGANVWIGDGVVILGPVIIGEGAVIGANSVVSRDVPAATMVAGIPAKILKQYNPLSGRWEKAQC